VPLIVTYVAFIELQHPFQLAVLWVSQQRKWNRVRCGWQLDVNVVLSVGLVNACKLTHHTAAPAAAAGHCSEVNRSDYVPAAWEWSVILQRPPVKGLGHIYLHTLSPSVTVVSLQCAHVNSTGVEHRHDWNASHWLLKVLLHTSTY